MFSTRVWSSGEAAVAGESRLGGGGGRRTVQMGLGQMGNDHADSERVPGHRARPGLRWSLFVCLFAMSGGGEKPS